MRKEVGFVFQFPEAQLFEETVKKDIAFAPKNFGKADEEAEAIAVRMAKMVDLPDEVLDKSPFELSGGQMRRVAIAGILAMEPKILVLDEPTAGLDPMGRLEMMRLFSRLHKNGMTIILVTHQMNDVADYADHALVLEHGRLIADTTPKALFSKPEWLREHHLDLPQTTKFAEKLMASGMKFDSLPLTKRELAQILADRIKGVLQMNKLLLGRYVNGDSLVHRMDARSKLVLSFYFVAIIFLCNNWQTYLLLAAFVLMCVKFSDLGIGFFIKGVKPLLGLIVFTVLLQVFFTRGGHVYWAFGPLSLTHFGIVNGFYVFCRFVLIIFMSTLLTLTTAPLEISDAIESL